MTQTHTLIAAALLAKPRRPAKHNVAILLGSLAPDAAVFALFIWSKFAGIPERQLWREVYFSEPMLTYTAIVNSLPLYLAVLLVGIFWVKTSRQKLPAGESRQQNKSIRVLATSSALGLFALAAITHLFGDFPFHASDAHPHFWPFTDWRFHSSISYWDRRHHGDLFSLIEAFAGVCLSVVLFLRFKSKWIRAMTLIAICAYLAVPAYFHFVLRGGAG